MPTEHKKNKSKTTTNIEIKIEGQDLHPLSHYLDDRVELVRQIFMSLKSKTIKSIAPDFLQGKSLETIQEYCLDELLGISKKRLESIINATQCPDNTDSSDSDVENIEEHISLEEISSDSADDTLRAKKSKKKLKVDDNKNGTTSTPGSGKKEISVLELLELQARARAIRSQLALEPVTKIELHSENDSDDSSAHKTGATSSATTSDNKKNQAKKAKKSSKSVVQETNGMQIIKPTVPKVKPVRLKRNFRQRQNDDYDPDEDEEMKSVENSETKETDKKSVEEKEEAVPVVNEERKESERSPSPDLIPIVQEPETYCISSDSDEGSSSVPKYITCPTVVREKLPETEDEKFLKKIKEGCGTDLRDLIKSKRVGRPVESSSNSCETTDAPNNAGTENAAPDELSSKENLENEEIPADKSEEKDKDTEPEEGELTDGDDHDEPNANHITILSSDDEIEEKINKFKSEIVEQVEENVDGETSSDSTTSENDSDANVGDETSSDSTTSENDSDSSVPPTFKEADDDDDIIDLGKYEELDFEMKDMERSEKKSKKLRKTKKKLQVMEEPAEAVPETTEDVRPIENKDDNEIAIRSDETTESADKNDAPSETPTGENTAESDTWQKRWLRGRNVTKVMATSRLANKVRSKIKQSKKAKPEETVPTDASAVTEAITADSTVEEGSVQHYEELLARDADERMK